MTKPKSKIALILVLTIVLLTIANTSKVMGSTVDWGTIQGQADNFISAGKDTSQGNLDMDQIKPTIISIGQILTTIGLAIVMVGLLVIGIKYMTSSPEEAAKIKGQLVGLVISAIVIFGAWGIWNIAVTFLNKMT